MPQMLAQPLDVGDQIPGGVVVEFRRAASTGRSRAGRTARCGSALDRRSAAFRVAAGARAAVQEHDRLALGVAALLVIHPVQRRNLQEAGVERLDLGIQGAAVGHAGTRAKGGVEAWHGDRANQRRPGLRRLRQNALPMHRNASGTVQGGGGRTTRTKQRRCLHASVAARKCSHGASKDNGRGGGIRTHDPLPPRQMRYQAALRPDVVA